MVKYQQQELNLVFSALSDPTRRAILERLAGGAASVTQIAQPFSMSFAAVSKHLSVLTQAGLVEAKRDGRFHRMELRSAPLKDASEWLDRYEKFWNQRFDALQRMMTKPQRKGR